MQRHEVLFVLEAPSESFTDRRWKECDATEVAIKAHRAIFFEWAKSGKQAHLFRLFCPMSPDRRWPSLAESFQRFYVTDIWKDGAFKKLGGDREYREYWLSKLSVELREVPTSRIILVGGEAARGQKLARKGTPVYRIPFPSQWVSEEKFKEHVSSLAREICRTERIGRI